jgi:hypothetical protein
MQPLIKQAPKSEAPFQAAFRLPAISPAWTPFYDIDGTINGVGANTTVLGFDGTKADSSDGVAILIE